MKPVRFALIVAASLLLIACENKEQADMPAPYTLTQDAMGRYCGMNVLEHAGPKGQIILEKIPEAIWFSSARDTVAFTMLPDEPKEIAAIYVSDMGKAPSWDEPGADNWIDARKAVFVIDSRLRAAWALKKRFPSPRRKLQRPSLPRMAGALCVSPIFPKATSWAQVKRATTMPQLREQTTMDKPVGRRRFITIMAAFAGLPLLPGKGWAALPAEPVVWHGQALGAPATLVLNHEDRAQAQALTTRVVAEVRRLEDIFSLYREDSALCQLNRLGVLAAPPTELVELLEISRRFHHLTAGRFEPAIQPLWTLYARHFAKPDADPAGPSHSEVRKALDLADFAQVRIDRNRIAFSRRGMALTFNGIAQGYVTDRVVGLLREAGVTSSLVDMGENRAIGSRTDGQAWRIGLAEFEDANDVDATLDITDRAVATSSGEASNSTPKAVSATFLTHATAPPLSGMPGFRS